MDTTTPPNKSPIERPTQAPLRVLVVEDNLPLREITVAVLSEAGYNTYGVESAESIPLSTHFDIALIDVNLPGENGFSVAARLRKASPNMGIIILSAYHSLEEKLTGYEKGADIYLAKPTAPEELCATIDALARRLRPTSVLQESPYILELSTGILHTPNGSLVLRRQEVEVLYALTVAPEHSLESAQLLQALKKQPDTYGKARLEVLISRLRTRLREYIPEQQGPIRAERGRGYRLNIELKIR